MTLTHAFDRYADEVAERQPSWTTTRYQLANLMRGLGAQTLLSDVTSNAVSAYVARRRGETSKRSKKDEPRPVSDASVNRELEVLRRVMRRAADLWNADVGRLPSWKALTLPEPEGRVREMTADEEGRLFAALRQDLHALVRFCTLTGIRKMNAVTLTWRQVDLDAGVIRLKLKSRKPGGEFHAVPITPAVAALLGAERGRHDTRVFTYERQHRGKDRIKGARYPLTQSGWRRVWRAALEAAGVDDFRFHDTRHTAATRVLRASKNLKAVQTMLGHKDIATTARYAHAMIDDVRAAMVAAQSRSFPEVVPDQTAKSLPRKGKRR